MTNFGWLHMSTKSFLHFKELILEKFDYNDLKLFINLKTFLILKIVIISEITHKPKVTH